MRIGIDARMYGKGFGLARYVESLVHGLPAHDTEYEFVLFMKPESIPEYRAAGGECEVVEASYHWYGWSEQIFFPRMISRARVDLMHFPHWNVPILYRGKYVVTIHDLTMFHFPRHDASTRSAMVYWCKDQVHRYVVRHAMRHAVHIIATSEFTKDDIVASLATKKEKITVVYQSPYLCDKKSISSMSPMHGKKYILYVGAVYPHKNVECLIHAWEYIQHEIPDHYLVLIGAASAGHTRLAEYIQKKHIPRVDMRGLVSDEELCEWYRHAAAFVFPSLYEGFGLPPLEAMATGTPVIASNAGSLPEVLGDGAYFINPHDSKHLAQGILDVITNDDIRHELRVHGREHVRMFSHERHIRGTRALYERVLI